MLSTLTRRALAAVGTAALTLALAACNSATVSDVTITDSLTQPSPDTSATLPVAEATDPVMLKTSDLMLMDLQSIGELSGFIGTTVTDTRSVYTVANDDGRHFTLTVDHDAASGTITAATLSYGETTADLFSDKGITGGIAAILRTDAIETVPLTFNKLLTLDVTAFTELNTFTFTMVDDTHRSYEVLHEELGKTCTLLIGIDEQGVVNEATLSYGDTTDDMLANGTAAIQTVLAAMNA